MILLSSTSWSVLYGVECYCVREAVAAEKYFKKYGNRAMLVLEGGADINPAIYGQINTFSHIDPLSRARDIREIQLVELAQDHGVPIFGICRGLQLLNAVFGGTLHQDIGYDLGTDHPYTHDVRVAGMLKKLDDVEDDFKHVNSLHHQAVADVAPGGVVLAIAKDHVIEAVHYPRQRAIGVQWHPEMMQDHALFELAFETLGGRT